MLSASFPIAPESRRKRLLLVCSVLLLVAGWALGCGKKKPAAPAQAPSPTLGSSDQVWVRHITIQYAGARGASRSVVRSRAAADSLVRGLRARLAKGEDFATLARAYSDDSSAPDGGEIAPLQPGDVPPEFEQAAAALKPGEMSQVVESPFGFHILQRKSTEKVAVQHILIRYHGAMNAPDSLLRGRAEALALAEKILGEVRSPDVSFPVAAYQYSEDEKTASLGGNVGEITRGAMVAAFDKAAFALQEEQISEVVETPFGFHIIKRVKPMTIRVSHILVTYSGSRHLDQWTQRTKEQALQLAADLLFRARKGEDFAALAREYSEDPVTKNRGGRLWLIERGMMVPEFEDAAFLLKPGQISDIVETEFGFHIIKRLY